MKYPFLIVLISSLLGFRYSLFQNARSIISKNNGSTVPIDTVIVDETVLDTLCFTINESSYPKVTGLNDKKFEDLLNRQFVINFNSFMDSAKHIYGGCLPKDELGEYSSSDAAFGFANGGFEILTQTDDIISVVQRFEGERSKAWNPYSTTINCNLKNKTFYTNADIVKSLGNDMNFFNKKIKGYFKQWVTDFFGDDKEQSGFRDDNINYLLITDKEEIKNLKFGIRNDSIMLVMEAQPTGTKDSYTTYIIPIDKCHKNISK